MHYESLYVQAGKLNGIATDEYLRGTTILSLREAQKWQFWMILSIREAYTTKDKTSMISAQMNICEAQQLKTISDGRLY